MTKNPHSAIILAGGEGRRFRGQNKAHAKVGGQRVIDRLMSVVQPMFDEIILVTNDPMSYLEWDMIIVTDHFNRRSSLTGIHSGLFVASRPHAMVLACDMPLVKPEMIELITGAVEPHLDVVIARTALGFEPLMAVYSKRCLKPIEAALINHQYQVNRIFKQVRTLEIKEPELRRCDPELTSFFNVNSLEDLAVAEERLHRPAQEGK